MMPPAAPLGREEGLARIRLLRSPRIGPITFHQLLRRFGSARAVLDHLPQLQAEGRLGKPGEAPWQAASRAQAEDEVAATRAAGGRYIFHDGEDYPPLLAGLDGAPPILIARGQAELARACPVAIVGARGASAGAQRLARMLAQGLAEAGHAVVSGLARGVDGAAHEGALAVQGGAGTIAAIAGGIDVAYPPEHAALQERIAQQGLLLTEAPPGTEPTNRHFPARNRIIAGLAAGTVVVEAALRSGSLITARLAGEFGREVMAVPGSPLDPRSHGTNAMIREGAILVQRSEDVIELLTHFDGTPVSRFAGAMAEADFEEAPPVAPPTPPMPADGTSLADRLAGLLSPVPVGVDELVRLCGAEAGAVQTALVEMELLGQALRHPGGKVSTPV